MLKSAKMPANTAMSSRAAVQEVVAAAAQDILPLAAVKVILAILSQELVAAAGDLSAAYIA
jgi:hypothetical protein